MKVNWKGNYCYTKLFDEENSYAFELILDFEDGNFEGISIEEEFTKAANASPTIRGFMTKEHISFVKQYPFEFKVDDKEKVYIDKEKEGHEVIYDGFFNQANNTWEGKWEIIVDEIEVSVGNFQTTTQIGAWKMNLD